MRHTAPSIFAPEVITFPDVAALKEQVLYFYENPEVRRVMGDAAAGGRRRVFPGPIIAIT
jgi:hypothetical protein